VAKGWAANRLSKRQLLSPLGGEGIATMKRLQNLLPNTLGACG
jgi:hypothetical protein